MRKGALRVAVFSLGKSAKAEEDLEQIGRDMLHEISL
jgi:hypothetical protein